MNIIHIYVGGCVYLWKVAESFHDMTTHDTPERQTMMKDMFYI